MSYRENGTKEKQIRMIAELQKQIMNVSRLAPGGQAGFPWPVGVREPSSPKTRFDVIRYDYFTETHVYLGTDHSNIAELRGADKEDVDDIIRVAKEKLLQKYGKKYVFGRLVNGYRRFDATRGMEYLLDVALRERDGDYELHRRVRLVRPLSHVEIVPMPYVTENTRVAVVLAARRSDRPRLAAFLRHYERTALAAGDNSVLMAVFVYEHAGDATAGDDDAFAEVKALVAAMERKYKDGAKIAWMNVRAREPSEFHLLDVVSKKFQPEALLLRTTADIELNPELLNRCRMNAILRWQVFFPMGFYEYKPSVVYGTDVAPPETLDINRVHGHFDRDAYEHACFYNGDYAETRKIIADAIPIVTDVKKVPDGVARAAAATPTPDLYELFLRSRLHVFRAVEPALRSRYRAVVCDAHAQEEAAYRRCLARRGEALGSRSQLAKLILDAQADEKGQEDQV
ncbi:PREDICTED: chondroitin sulfate synthase 2-like [Priapulus caudatus]|uniref:Hexosyltransferase n=1 Tax=Priapulus caudatus TaxID=37621 RepID=A0ABM1EDS5_PRICU|nr:PREDICTED: chondroitin sulfate synthase 2-like [Priapulus caudatus]